ncbi:apolipoprotein N-acyltransferase [Litorihabitans aurantiacus]|uniref:apolipoprotein N-acyltransferase n=1 Tax=Litorihabitans aurantiacus TaxID=1930061 RepID=UPI0024E04A64|nr:apolipoprotein N-acyltransferase [Litorihabitans aurantiacus]
MGASHPALTHRAWLAAPAFALVWTTGEIVRSLVPFGGFPWGRIAFSQTGSPLLRLAALGGATLVSTVVALLALVAATAWWGLRRRHPARAVGAALVVVAVPVAALAVPLDVRAQEGRASVGIVQGNVSEPGLGAFHNAREVIGNHSRGTIGLAGEHAGELDVVLWPENAADYDPRTDDQARDAVELAAETIGAPIMLGTQSYAFDDEGRATARYNDVVLWEPGVGATEVYAKQHPAPFAEYVPLRDLARRFSDAVDLVSVDMAPGREVGIVPVEVDGRSVPFGVAICFEVAYDALVRESVAQGAEVIVVPTNNASFGDTAESEQQLAMTIFRAVEHGRAAVQVSTVGVSGVVTPNGVVTQRTELFTADALTADLPLRTSLTLATRLGVVPDVVVGGLTAVLLALGIGLGRMRGADRERGARAGSGSRRR